MLYNNYNLYVEQIVITLESQNPPTPCPVTSVTRNVLPIVTTLVAPGNNLEPRSVPFQNLVKLLCIHKYVRLG